MDRNIFRLLGDIFIHPATLWRYREFYGSYRYFLQSIGGRIVRAFYKPTLPHNVGDKIYLHLGCGDVNHPQFINIDVIPAPHIHYVRSIDNLSIFKNSSVDLIYASHCLEHFPMRAIDSVLKEWHRVLRPDGILRLSVPDFDTLLKIYLENDNDITPILGALMGGQTYFHNYHKILFTEKSLALLLTTAGFNTVRLWIPQSSELTTFDDWSSRPITVNGKECRVSLNIEAVK